MSSKKKLGSINEQQKKFIRMYINDFPVSYIMDELGITENQVTGWMISNPVFLSSLNSSIYLLELSLYIRQLNLRTKALRELEEYLDSGNTDAIQVTLANVESMPEFSLDSLNAKRIQKSNVQAFLRSIESDFNPRKFREDYDDEAPF